MTAPGRAGQTWQGGPWGERAHAVLCPNPSPMTLEGTNTWVLLEPGGCEAVVVDPGPLQEDHLQAVLAEVSGRDARVALTLLTHGHADHAESADRWAELTRAPVRRWGPGHADLAPGECLRVGGLEVLVVPTPGHTADSVSFHLPVEGVLFSGDTVLGRGTTVVAYPDGDLTSYLESLERLRTLTGSGAVTSIAPGHGPVIQDGAEVVEHYIGHRHQRLDQVRAAVVALGGCSGAGKSGQDLADLVVERVYADTPRAVRQAARLSVLAQLDYLGELKSERAPHED